MTPGLPIIPNTGSRRRAVQTQFGGYDRSAGASDGAIRDMTNISGDSWPLLSPRAPRHRLRTLETPNGVYSGDGFFHVDSTDFYADGVRRGTVTDTKKRFASLGAYVVILPDGAYYDRERGSFGSLAASASGSMSVLDGTYAGEPANANTLYMSGANWQEKFRAGDAVTVKGLPGGEVTAVVREIDGDSLRFYDNTFGSTYSGGLTVSRDLPEMDFIFENENRLWGCKGDTIYASKLGDPFNWNVFDGISTDSYAVRVGSAGDFTGACAYLGYPCFFKEEQVYKVYGDRPSNFQVMGSASLGVAEGSGGSLAVAGETLYYLSRAGIVAYSGGMPKSVSAPFGAERFRNANAGSDGTKYYVSMQSEDSGKYSLFVFDTRLGMWFREDDIEAVDFCTLYGGLCFLSADGGLWSVGGRELPRDAVPEGTVRSSAEFADFTSGEPNRKGLMKLIVRMELDAGSRVTVSMLDSPDGEWQRAAELTAEGKRSFVIPLVPRRADSFRIRFEAEGGYRLHSLVREFYVGSEL